MYNIKFRLFQAVYYISQCSVPEKKHKCTLCNGKKYVKINEKTFKCPECYGEGHIVTKYVKKWIPSEKPRKILRILIEPDLGNLNKDHLDSKILYILYPGYYSILQENIFSTYEEALRQCDKLNKK